MHNINWQKYPVAYGEIMFFLGGVIYLSVIYYLL